MYMWKRRVISIVLAVVLLAGCGGFGEMTGTPSSKETKIHSPSATDSESFSGYENCSLNSVPRKNLNLTASEYPLSPKNRTEKGLRQFVEAFERAYVFNEYYDGSEDEFYVTFSDTTIVTDDATKVKIPRVHHVESNEGTPADQWYSTTYILRSDGVVRDIGPQNNPPSGESGKYVLTCE